jgi:hypothetical protein
MSTGHHFSIAATAINTYGYDENFIGVNRLFGRSCRVISALLDATA